MSTTETPVTTTTATNAVKAAQKLQEASIKCKYCFQIKLNGVDSVKNGRSVVQVSYMDNLVITGVSVGIGSKTVLVTDSIEINKF